MGHGLRQLTNNEAQYQKHHQRAALSQQRVHANSLACNPSALQRRSAPAGAVRTAHTMELTLESGSAGAEGGTSARLAGMIMTHESMQT